MGWRWLVSRESIALFNNGHFWILGFWILGFSHAENQFIVLHKSAEQEQEEAIKGLQMLDEQGRTKTLWVCNLLPTTWSIRTQTQAMSKMQTSLLLRKRPWKRLPRKTLEDMYYFFYTLLCGSQHATTLHHHLRSTTLSTIPHTMRHRNINRPIQIRHDWWPHLQWLSFPTYNRLLLQLWSMKTIL